MEILLIEDSEPDADLIIEKTAIATEDQESYHKNPILFHWVNNIDQALIVLENKAFDLILLDLDLTGNKDEVDNLSNLTDLLSIRTDIPIVILTGNTNERTWLQAVQAGAQDYLVKNETSPSLLLRTINYALERQKLKAKIVESNRELENFAYVASHDLREPLRKVINFGTRLKDKYREQLDEKGQNCIDIMHGASLRMRDLLDALLEYSRVGSREMKLEVVDMQSMLQDIISDLGPRITESKAKIELCENLPQVKAEPNLLRDLFQNLITNALKFRKPGLDPIIKVSVQKANELNWEISIQDNGIGFKPELQEKIFEQFMKVHGKDEYEGHGMGLATCRKIAQRHGGTIIAESEPDQGACFKVRLPA